MQGLPPKSHNHCAPAKPAGVGAGIVTDFDDNTINGIVAPGLYRTLLQREALIGIDAMSSLKLKLGLLAAGLMLSGCMQGTTYEATNAQAFKPKDKELLAKVRYTNVPVAE